MDMFRGLSPWGARVGDLEPCENSARRSWQVAFLGKTEPRAARPEDVPGD